MEQTEQTEQTLLTPDEWENLTVNELYDQRKILFDKWMFLVQKNYPYAKDIESGIKKIEKIIEDKSQTF